MKKGMAVEGYIQEDGTVRPLEKYDDTELRGKIQTNTDNIDNLDSRVTSLEQHGAPSTDAAKADKVTGATPNNLAGLDEFGNLKDSGVPAANVTPLISGSIDGLTTAGIYKVRIAESGSVKVKVLYVINEEVGNRTNITQILHGGNEYKIRIKIGSGEWGTWIPGSFLAVEDLVNTLASKKFDIDKKNGMLPAFSMKATNITSNSFKITFKSTHYITKLMFEELWDNGSMASFEVGNAELTTGGESMERCSVSVARVDDGEDVYWKMYIIRPNGDVYSATIDGTTHNTYEELARFTLQFTKVATGYDIDTEPHSGGQKPISSGAVYTALLNAKRTTLNGTAIPIFVFNRVDGLYFIEELDNSEEKKAFAEQFDDDGVFYERKNYLCELVLNGDHGYGILSYTINSSTGQCSFYIENDLHRYAGSINLINYSTTGKFTVTDLYHATVPSHNHDSISGSKASVTLSEYNNHGEIILNVMDDNDNDHEVTINPSKIDNLERALATPSSTPENNANKLITSGAVYDALTALRTVLSISISRDDSANPQFNAVAGSKPTLNTLITKLEEDKAYACILKMTVVVIGGRTNTETYGIVRWREIEDNSVTKREVTVFIGGFVKFVTLAQADSTNGWANPQWASTWTRSEIDSTPFSNSAVTSGGTPAANDPGLNPGNGNV